MSITKYIFTLALSVVLLPLTSAQTGNELPALIGQVINEDMLTELLGSNYTFDKSRSTYRPAVGTYDFSIKESVIVDPNDKDSYLRVVDEIFVSGDYFDRPPVNGTAFPGIKPRERKDRVLTTLQDNSAVSEIEEGGDLNGQFIKFRYELPGRDTSCYYQFRFRADKKHQRLVSFYVSRRG